MLKYDVKSQFFKKKYFGCAAINYNSADLYMEHSDVFLINRTYAFLNTSTVQLLMPASFDANDFVEQNLC